MKNPFESPSANKDVQPIAAELSVKEKVFKIKKYEIGNSSNESEQETSPGLMATGSIQEVEEIYKDDPLRIDNFIPVNSFMPYAFLQSEGSNVYGNYTDNKGQDEFLNADLQLTDEKIAPPEWSKEILEFVRAKEGRNFQIDSEVACIRSLSVKDGKMVFTVGKGLYSDSFYTNGSEGVIIGLSGQEKEVLLKKGYLSPAEIEDLSRKAQELEGEYGKNKTLREILLSHYGRLPEFGEQVYNNSIGVAGMVLSQDNEFVFVNRGSKVSINQGINCTASGAVEFNKDALSKYGLQETLGREISRETNEELGLNAGSLILGSMKKRIELELGVSESQYELVPVGFIRELSRGGKPECMFLIRYHGSTNDLVQRIMSNPHQDKEEIEGHVLSLPSSQVDELLRTEGLTSTIQHKGVANLALCQSFLRHAR